MMIKNDKKLQQAAGWLTTKELAARYGVLKRVALGWIERNYFPHAVKKESEIGVFFWLIPESDLNGFQPQTRRGKPHSETASKSAVMRRGRRSKVK